MSISSIFHQACNSEGHVGMVPENYIESYEDTASLSADTSGSGGNVNSEAMSQHNNQQYNPNPAAVAAAAALAQQQQQQYDTYAQPPPSTTQGRFLVNIS